MTLPDSETSVPVVELVRVSGEMVKELLEQEPRPVVLVGMERHDDGTCELLFQTTDLIAERDRYREALTNVVGFCAAGERLTQNQQLRNIQNVARHALKGGQDGE